MDLENVWLLIYCFKFGSAFQRHSSRNYIESFLENLTVKNFENWSTFAEIMITSQVYCFLDTE